MRQGILVTVLLCLIGVPTVLLTDGLDGFTLRWPTSTARLFIGAKPFTSPKAIATSPAPAPRTTRSPAPATTPSATTDWLASGGFAAARAFAAGASQLRLNGREGTARFLSAPTPGAATADQADFADVLHQVDASIATANVAAANLAVASDYNAAVKWYALANDPDDAEARYAIAMDFLGREPEPDFASAAFWLRTAAELGEPRAERELADLYAAGTGVERNPAAAYAWYTLAEQGLTRDDDRALVADKRDRLADALTPAQQAAADRMIGERAPRIATLVVVEPGLTEIDTAAATGLVAIVSGE